MKPPSDRTPAFETTLSARPEWTQEEAIRYEVAREAVTALMAFRSQWIFDEEAKPSADHMLIERWESERAALAAELRGLHVCDHERVARICRVYGAEIRRLDALEAQRERCDR
jgi:hypothetical protein